MDALLVSGVLMLSQSGVFAGKIRIRMVVLPWSLIQARNFADSSRCAAPCAAAQVLKRMHQAAISADGSL